MGSTLDLGRRVELVSMDPHFSNITIALYECSGGEYVVHSYSIMTGARERLDAVTRAMQVLGGLALRNGRLSFPCGARHLLAIRRTFLEACKLNPEAAGDLEARPLGVVDKKLDGSVSVRSLGDGLYEFAADKTGDAAASRVESIAGGLRKLAEADFVDGEPYRIRFACGQAHDALVGLLLPRALNVRAALREQEMAAARGMLVAPSAQK